MCRGTATPFAPAICSAAGGPKRGGKGQQVIEVILQHIARHVDIHVGVAVHENISKPGSGTQLHGKVLRDAPSLLEQMKQLLIGRGFTQSIVGYDVRSRVQTRLNRELERVFYE